MRTSESVQAWLGYLFVDELIALKKLARMLPEHPTVINIGAGGGTSGLAFKESRPDLWLITIDVQDESSPYGCLEGERVVMTEAGYKMGIDDGWFQIHMDSKEAGRRWGDNFLYADDKMGYNPFPPFVDMVFVDGDHSYEGCKGDIEAWLPRIEPNGIIAVHDYDKAFAFAKPDERKRPHPRVWPGVDRAVNELLKPNFHEIIRVDSLIAFEVNYGKTVHRPSQDARKRRGSRREKQRSIPSRFVR